MDGNMPKEETINKNMWIKLTGPAAESLGKAFFGPTVVVLQENRGARGGAEEGKVDEDAAILPPGREAEGGGVLCERGGTTVSVAPKRIVIAGTARAGKSIKVLRTYRIVLLGKTRAGKSSLANTIFGEDVFKINHTPISGTSECQAASKSVDGRRITLIDTPGFFDFSSTEEELKCEIVKCFSECTPGPHAFFIVLNVKGFSEQEQAVIKKIHQYFSEEVFKYAAVVFTHGEQLPEGQTIEDFVNNNKVVSDLVMRCGGHCHVVDNKHWKNNQQDEYRSNKFQVAELLKTTDKIVMENKGYCYTNKMLQPVKRETNEECNTASVGNLPQEYTSNKANNTASKNVWIKLTGPAAESLAESFCGAAVVVLQETVGEDEQEGKVEDGETETEDEAITETNEESEEETATDTEEEITETEEKEAITETQEETATDTEEETIKETEKEAEKEKEKDKEATEKAATEKETKRPVGGAGGAGSAASAALAALAASAASAVAGASALAGALAALAALAALVASAVAGASAASAASAVAGASAASAASTASAAPAASTASAAPAASAASAASTAPATAGIAAKVATALKAALTLLVGGTIVWIATIIYKLIAFLKSLPRRIGIILLVVVFYSLLLLSFGVQVPIFGTFLLLFGVLLLFVLLVVLLLLL